MIKATPAVENLVEEIRLKITQGSINELELARLRNKAKKLMNADATQAYCALGIIATEESKEELARKNFSAAIRVSDHDELAQVFFNFGASLIIFDHYQEGMEKLIEAVEIEKNNLTFLDDVIWLMYKHDDERLGEFLQIWENRTNGNPHGVVEHLDQELTAFCMISSQSSLADIWDTPEEDEAWQHLQ